MADNLAEALLQENAAGDSCATTTERTVSIGPSDEHATKSRSNSASYAIRARQTSDVVELIKSPPARCVLQFSGVVWPTNPRSPYRLCYVLIRLGLLAMLFDGAARLNATSAQWLAGFFNTEVDPKVDLGFGLCDVLNAASTSAQLYWLPQRLAKPSLACFTVRRDTTSPAWLAMRFMTVVSGTLSVIYLCFGVLVDSPSNFLFAWPGVATTAVDSAVLLLVAQDCADARAVVLVLHDAAYEKTLDRRAYVNARDSIEQRSKVWSGMLGLLSFKAILCSFAWIVEQLHFIMTYQNEKESWNGTGNMATWPFVAQYIVYSLWSGVWYGKESALLIVLLALVSRINDEADALTAILADEEWGVPGSPAESARLDLWSLCTTYSVRPQSLHSIWSFVSARRFQPITFPVCGLRITREKVIGCALTISLSISYSVIRGFTTIDYR